MTLLPKPSPTPLSLSRKTLIALVCIASYCGGMVFGFIIGEISFDTLLSTQGKLAVCKQELLSLKLSTGILPPDVFPVPYSGDTSK